MEKADIIEGLQEREQSSNVGSFRKPSKTIDEATALLLQVMKSGMVFKNLPLVRRIFGEISAKNFVSVQPMNLPSGLIFYQILNTTTHNL